MVIVSICVSVGVQFQVVSKWIFKTLTRFSMKSIKDPLCYNLKRTPEDWRAVSRVRGSRVPGDGETHPCSWTPADVGLEAAEEARGPGSTKQSAFGS